MNETLSTDTDRSQRSTGPHEFQMNGWISCAPFERLLNITILEAAGGHAVLRMPFFIDYAQGAGFMHGGALVSLADTAVVMAIKSIVAPGTHFATISLASNFLYPVKQGIVTAVADVDASEERILRGRAAVYNEEKRSVLEFNSVFKLAKDTRIKAVVFNPQSA